MQMKGEVEFKDSKDSKLICAQSKISPFQTDPLFPTAVTNRSWTSAVNFTTDYERGVGRVTADLDYVSFACPEGFVFKSNVARTNLVRAFCHNAEWHLTYDPDTHCIRECHVHL